jgi:hypothetical protein
MTLSYPSNGSVRRFALRISLLLNRSFGVQRTLVAQATQGVSAWSKRSQHTLSRSLVSMTSVPSRSWPDHGPVIAFCKAMLVRNRLNIMHITRRGEDFLCG